ncbi:protoheme IX farnesyltransferase, mitochondrial isoform X2 [Macrosteles quadrilineatus]|uniref:protoheme IX farnesyltransferase, mitochondrial isoform X2 n=1 Tax=Macrosteles quadrilineatus TaxID=74068 RepID=UPI0023E2B07D|nr:protoheme IX farnesyltransferase, mitochondrial isoform X2 [Macrosteles quadrilineatus]
MFYIVKSWQRLNNCSHSPLHNIKLFIHPIIRSTKTATVPKLSHDKTTVVHVAAVVPQQTTQPPRAVPNTTTTTTSPEPDTCDKWIPVVLDWQSLPKHYLKLSKSRLTSLVVLTSMAGYAMAPAPFDPSTFALCSVGTGLLSCAANSINQYHEVPFDAQMARTRNRILVRGHLTPIHALGFASVCATTGVALLYVGVNPLTTMLGITNLVLYTSVYTPLKRISILNTWVGSVVGALPPLMGWAACSGALEPGAWVLAGLLYAWQFPHFNALSWNLRPDYSRAGYRMMSVTNPGLCRRTALRYTALLVPLSVSASLLDMTNQWFAYASLPLNLYFLLLAWRFHRKSDSSSSRKLFHFSLIQLPVLMLLLLFTKKHWYTKKEEETKVQAAVVSESLPLTLPFVVKPTL